MRLLFAYTEFLDRDGKKSSHRGLSHLSLNFSTDRRFSYQGNTLTMTQMTQLEPPIPPIPPNFFGNRIYNVTTFVGDNGAGKTTILHYLIDLLRQFYEGQYRGSDRGLLVVEDQERTYLLKYGECPLHLDHIPDGVECVNLGEESNKLLSSTKLIYLANTLTPSDLTLMGHRPEKTDNQYVNLFHFRHEFLYNCSTVSLMVENCKNDSENISEKPISPATDYLNCFFNYEQYKQVKYVFDKRQYGILEELHGKGHPVPVPKKLIVELQRMDYSVILIANDTPLLREGIYLGTLEDQYAWLAWELCNSCMQTFVKTTLLHTEVRQEREYLNNIINETKWLSLRYSRLDDCKAMFLEIIGEIKDIHSCVSNQQKMKNLDLIEKVAGYCIDFFNFVFEEKEHLRQYFEMEPLVGKTVGKDEKTITFAIKTTGEAAEWFITFLQKYRYTCEPYYYLNFRWGLSSGEQNLLRMFSSLYYIFDADYNNPERGDYKIYNKGEQDRRMPCNSVLLWLDEADLTYHPEWQRRFLSILTAFLPKVYPETCCQDIQVFLTTHSPLMLGDSPAQSVIYLSKDSQGHVTVDDSGSRQTFGENLYTLLQNSFDVKGGAIGELVRIKIQEILDALSEVDEKLLPNKKVSRKELRRCQDQLQDFRDATVAFLADGIIKAKLNTEIDRRLKQLEKYAPVERSEEESRCAQLSSAELERWLKALKKEQKLRKEKRS